MRVSAFGAPSELKTESIQRPEVGPGEVLVRVVAAGVNPVETYKRAVTPQQTNENPTNPKPLNQNPGSNPKP